MADKTAIHHFMNTNKTGLNALYDLRRHMNGTRAVPTVDPLLAEATLTIDKVVSPFLYVFGFPGNILAFIVWQQPRMRHSSGTYLAALAITDLLFLFIHVVYELYKIWGVDTIEYPGICELIPAVHLATQYLSPLLVLGFTVERYIAICFPLKRPILCTTKRAKLVSLLLMVFSLLLGSMQAYIYTYDSRYKFCLVRASAIEGGATSLWSIWTWITEMLIFLCVPLVILLFNILIIVQIKKLSSLEIDTGGFQTVTTTFSLLIVSFYFIITSFPVSIVYAMRYNFLPEEAMVSDVDITSTIMKYQLARTIIEEIGMTHFACKFYIFLVAERLFREEFKNVMGRFFCNRKKEVADYTHHTVLQTDCMETEAPAPVHNPEETSM